MARFNTLPDLEAVAGTCLRSAAIVGLGTRVYSSVPKDPTYPLVTVQRIGGIPAVRQRLDAVSLQVDVWGGTKSEARDIAAAARIALLELEGVQVTDPVAANITAVDDSLGLTWAPDPVTARDRYLFGVTVYGTAGFSPTEISGLQLWLPAESIQGVADGSRVSSWPDKSGNGFDAVQATGSKQPLWFSQAANGRPAVRFDGTNDFLSCNSLATLLSGSDVPFTCIVVAKGDGDGDGNGLISACTGTGNHFITFRWGNGGEDRQELVRRDATTTVSRSGTLAPGTTFRVGACVFAGTAVELFLDGSADGASQASDVGTITATIGFVGALDLSGTPGDFFNGDIAEVLCWNRALTNVERRKVEAYLSRRYAIPVT